MKGGAGGGRVGTEELISRHTCCRQSAKVEHVFKE